MNMEQSGLQLLETIHPIGKVKLNIPTDKRLLIKSIIKDDAFNLKNHPGKSTNIVAEHRTSWHMNHFNPIFGEISDSVIDVLNYFTGHARRWETKDCWGAIYQRGDEATAHIHSVVWAWTYYAECCPKCSPLVFEQRNLEIIPEEDTLIFWNGILANDKYQYNMHCVPPQECEHDRVMVAGNID